MRRYQFRLHISAKRLLSYYRGAATTVSVESFDGKKLRFPAERLRGHATRDGIHGTFELRASDEGKFVELVKLEA